MAVRRVQLRRGTTNEHTQNGGFIGAVGEITVDTTTKSIRVHDGVTAGGLDLMRADMSNNLDVVGNINFTDAPHAIGEAINTVGDANNILDLGAANTTVRIRGTLSVNQQSTQNDLLVEKKLIVLADGSETEALSNDSIGVIFTRTTDGAGPGNPQDPALLFWDEANDRFSLATASVDENEADWTQDADYALTDLAVANLYATAGLDLNDTNITNVSQISLDTITYDADLNTITLNAKDTQPGAFIVKADAGDEEQYLKVDTDTQLTTLGVNSAETILRSNLITLGTNTSVNIAVEAETTTLVEGLDLTISAGTSTLAGNTAGGDLILASGGGTGTGTSSIQFKTKLSGTDNATETMRIHTTGYVGIGENNPDSGLHLTGDDSKAILTLENSTGGNAQDDDPTTISFKSTGETLAQIVGAHDGVADDDKGVLIFKPNNDTAPTEALRLDSTLRATFAGDVTINGGDIEIVAGQNTSANIVLKSDEGDDAGDEWQLQAQANNDTFTIGNDKAVAGTYAPILTLLSNAVATDTLATFAGDVKIEGDNITGRDADTLAIISNTDLIFKVDLDNNGNNSFSFVNGDDTEIANLNESGDLQLDGTITSYGSATIGVAGQGNPDLSIVNNAGDTTFSVTGLSGDTVIEGTSTTTGIATFKDSIAIQSQPDGDLGIQFNSDRAGANINGTTYDVKVIEVGATGAGNGTDGVILWDDDQASFSITSGKLNTETQLSVGPIASPNVTLVPTTGAITSVGTDAYLTLRNNVDEFGDGGAETKIIFEDHSTTALAQIQASHDGGLNDTKGDLIFSTHTGVALTEALRLDSAQLATFAGELKLEGDNITGKTDSDLSILSEANLIFRVDSDADDGNNIFSFVNGANAEIAQLNESGDLQLDGDLIVSGEDITLGTNTSTSVTLKALTQTALNQNGASLTLTTGRGNGTGEGGSFVVETGGENGAAVATALTIDYAKLATFAGNVTVSGNTITFGNGATLVNTDANTLTVTENLVALSGDLKVGGNDIINANGDSVITFSSDALKNTTFAGDVTIIGGKITLSNGATIDSETPGLLILTEDTTVTTGDLIVRGGADTATLTLGVDQAQDSKIVVAARTGDNDGQDLTLEAGSADAGQANKNGGDLVLSAGGGDGGAGTSNVIVKTKISGTATPTEKVRVLGSGHVGLGESDPETLLHLSHATNPTITLQNLTAGNANGDRASVLTFKGEKADNTEGELGRITISHDGANDDLKGKMVFSTYATIDWQNNAVNAVQPVLTLDSTQRASFAGNVVIAGNLQVDGDTTTINTATLDVEDAVIRLNKGIAGGANSNDIGIFFERGTTGDDGIFFYGEDEDFFVLGTTTQDDHTVTDFFASTTPGGLMLGSLELRDNQATSLVIKEGANAYLTFVTTDAGEKITFGKTFEAVTGSKIGDIQISNGLIETTNANNNLSFNDNNLTTTGTANFGATTVDSLDASNGGITNAGAISSVTNISGSDLDINLTDNEATSLEVKEAGLGSYLTFVTTDNAEEVVFNQGGADIDFRVEGDSNAHLIFARGSDDTVGIKNSDPQFTLDITGTLGVSGLADLNGGIDVNNSNFTVANTGATQIANTLTLTNAGGTSDLIVQDNGTNVLVVDVSANTATLGLDDAGATSATFKADKLQATNQETNIFKIIPQGNVANALEVKDTADVSYMVFNTTTNTELITLAQDTSLSETLSVTGITTLDDTLKIKSAPTGATAITINSDRTNVAKGGAGTDVNILFVEGGDNGTDAFIKWDDSEDSFKIEGGKLFSATEVSIGTEAGGVLTKNITMSTAGVITATASASAFASGTTIGTLDFVDNEISDTALVVKSGSDLTLHIDSDGDGANKFSFVHGVVPTEIANLDESGNLTLAGNIVGDADEAKTIFAATTTSTNLITLGGGGKVVTAGDLKVEGGDIELGVGSSTALTLKAPTQTGVNIDGASLTLTTGVGNGTGDGGSFVVETGGENGGVAATALTIDHTKLATFTGSMIVENDLSVNGGDFTLTAGQATSAIINLIADEGDDNGDSWKVEATDHLTNTLVISNDISGAQVAQLTLEGDAVATSGLATFAGQVLINGTGASALDFTANDITIGNSIGANTLTLGATASTVAIPGDLTVATNKSITLNSGAAGADAEIIVERTDGNNAVLSWVEATDRFEVDNATGTSYSLLTENDTLFTFDVDGANTLSIEQTDNTTVLFKGAADADNQGLIFDIDGNSITLSFENPVKMPGALTLGGDLTAVNVSATNEFFGPGADLSNRLEIRSSTDNSSAKTAILLNSNQSGVPADTEDVSIVVERGDSTNASLTWDEGDDRWTLDQGNGSNAIVTTKASEGARYECASVASGTTLSAPTAVENKHAYFINNGANAGSLTLFALAGTTYNGYVLQIINQGTNTITVNGNGVQTINGDPSVDLNINGCLSLIAFGTSWYIL